MPETPARNPLRPGPGRPFEDDVEQVLAGIGDGAPRLPRRQVGSAPQNLAVTLMADYTIRTRAWLPSAAVVSLLMQFEVSVSNARAAISRLARRGVLDTDKRGRNTFYRLSESSDAYLRRSAWHLARHPTTAESWDGNWTLAVFSLAKDHGARRRALRSQLRWQGFAPLYDGLWVHPMPLAASGVESLTDIAPGAITIFRGEHQTFALELGRTPLDAWDLAGMEHRYREFVGRWQAQLERPDFARISGVDAVRARSAVIEEYRLLPLLDPAVPLSMMPADWPRPIAHRTFAAVYDGLAAPASAHVSRVIAAAAGMVVPIGISAHTVAEMAAGLGGGTARDGIRSA